LAIPSLTLISLLILRAGISAQNASKALVLRNDNDGTLRTTSLRFSPKNQPDISSPARTSFVGFIRRIRSRLAGEIEAAFHSRLARRPWRARFLCDRQQMNKARQVLVY
jgi:hypothetical protein